MPSATFSGNGAYRLDVTPWTSGTTVGVNVAVTKTSGGGFWTASPTSWGVSIDGQFFGGSWTYDFRASTPQTIAITTQSANTGGGVRGYSVTVNMNSGIGSATVNGSVTASTPPAAPTPVGFDQVTAEGFRYQFSGNWDGGSPITGWEVRIASDVNFSQDVQTVGSNGLTTFTGLTPGATYWVAARGSNSVGWGPWGEVRTVTLLSGVWVGGRARPVYVSEGGVWRNADIYTSNGTTWKKAG